MGTYVEQLEADFGQVHLMKLLRWCNARFPGNECVAVVGPETFAVLMYEARSVHTPHMEVDGQRLRYFNVLSIYPGKIPDSEVHLGPATHFAPAIKDPAIALKATVS
jgi:hypothetical protein